MESSGKQFVTRRLSMLTNERHLPGCLVFHSECRYQYFLENCYFRLQSRNYFSASRWKQLVSPELKGPYVKCIISWKRTSYLTWIWAHACCWQVSIQQTLALLGGFLTWKIPWMVKLLCMKQIYVKNGIRGTRDIEAFSIQTKW